MARVKSGVTRSKRRKNTLQATTGYRFGRSKKKREAREATYHAQLHAFDHRKDKKGDFRRLWTTRINAALHGFDLKYSRFIKTLKDQNIVIDRKILATLAKDRPDAFERLVKKVNE